MSIAYLIAAFSCGVLACTMGACQSFMMAGFVGVAGIAVAAAMNAAALVSPEMAATLFPAVAAGQSDVMGAVLGNVGPMIGNIAFDVMFAPGIAFTAPLWAGAYARIRGYVKPIDTANAQCWFAPLEPYRQVDVLLVGGLGGMIGAIINWFFPTFLGIGIDGHSCSILISCLVLKLLMGDPLIAPRNEEQKKKGSRWSPNQEQGWLGHLSKASIRYTLAIFCGACFAYAERTLMLNPLTFGTAHLIGFLFGAFGLVFLLMGFNVQVLPPITASACFVVKGMVIAAGNTPEAVAGISPITFMLWGAAGGCLGIFFCHFMIQTFKALSPDYVDPPAASIFFTSFIGFTIIPSISALAGSIVFPVVVIALSLCHILYERIKYKDTAYKPYKERMLEETA